MHSGQMLLGISEVGGHPGQSTDSGAGWLGPDVVQSPPSYVILGKSLSEPVSSYVK